MKITEMHTMALLFAYAGEEHPKALEIEKELTKRGIDPYQFCVDLGNLICRYFNEWVERERKNNDTCCKT